VLPPETGSPKLREDLELKRAEADATIRMVDALGAQLRILAESPGIRDLLQGAGKAFETRATMDLRAQEQAHERQQKTAELESLREKRRDYLGAVFLALLALLVLAGAWLVGTGKIDTKSALAAVSVLAALGAGRLAKPK
jgi:hypothetical protein